MITIVASMSILAIRWILASSTGGRNNTMRKPSHKHPEEQGDNPSRHALAILCGENRQNWLGLRGWAGWACRTGLSLRCRIKLFATSVKLSLQQVEHCTVGFWRLADLEYARAAGRILP